MEVGGGPPTGKSIPRTPPAQISSAIQGSDDDNASVAVSGSDATTDVHSPLTVGASGYKTPAKIVGQQARESEESTPKKSVTPRLPILNTLQLTNEIDSILTKVKERCNQNRVLWEDVCKDNLLPEQFRTEYDEDLLFLAPHGLADDITANQLNELSSLCRTASDRLKILAGSSDKTSADVTPKLKVTAQISLFNIDCLQEYVDSRISIGECVQQMRQLGAKCLEISQDLCVIDEQAKVARAIFRNNMLIPKKVNRNRDQVQQAVAILHRHLDEPQRFINQIKQNVIKLDTFIDMATQCNKEYRDLLSFPRPVNSSMETMFPDGYKQQIWMSICVGKWSLANHTDMEISYNRNQGDQVDGKFFAAFDEIAKIRYKNKTASRVLLRAFDMGFLNTHNNVPITLVRLGAFQIGDYYKKIKEHLEQVLSEPWVTDLGREYSWIMSALQKSEDNKKKLQQKNNK